MVKIAKIEILPPDYKIHSRQHIDKIGRLVNRIRLLVEKLGESLVPMVENLDSTLSYLNGEIGSINELTQSAGSIVKQFEKIIRLARIIVTTPIIKIISTGMGFAYEFKKAVGKNNKNNFNKEKEEEAKNES